MKDHFTIIKTSVNRFFRNACLVVAGLFFISSIRLGRNRLPVWSKSGMVLLQTLQILPFGKMVMLVTRLRTI